jgi:protein transport protein SEC61 subunit gamma and related proteins
MEELKPSLMNKGMAFLRECRRVLTVTKKPTSEEFKAIVKVSALGMAVIGLIGFTIQMIKIYFF